MSEDPSPDGALDQDRANHAALQVHTVDILESLLFGRENYSTQRRKPPGFSHNKESGGIGLNYSTGVDL